MRKLVQTFLSPADRERVVAAVRAAEARTAVEIVPMVVGASDTYPKAELACAVTCGLVAGLACTLAAGSRSMWLYLLFFGLFSLAAFEAAKRLPALKRIFVSPERARHETRQAAEAAFHTHGLACTAGRHAVLLYVSVFEHLVFILPDAGLAGKLAPSTLAAATDALAAGIRRGRQAEALSEAVATLAEALTPLYPPLPDQANALKDLILL
uniref:Putative membrane protein n=1 Tax=Desulfovibrio sp. U5L TaxID=596152 RepID=I2Q0E9_9BACT